MTRIAAAVLALALAPPLLAQGDPDDVHDLPSERTLRPVPATPADRVEVVAGEPTIASISLEQALVSALERNLDLAVEAHTPLLREADVTLARSRFDPVGFWRISRQRSIQQGSSQLSGGNTVEQVLDQMRTGVRKTGLLGTTYDVAVGGRRTASNSSFANQRVQYASDVTLTITQPLLRNLGLASNRADVDLASSALDQAYYGFQNTAIDVVTRTERAYWDLVFARENHGIQADGLRLAEETLAITRVKLDVGTASRIDVLDAQSDVSEARRVLIQAVNQVQDAEDAVKGLVDPSDMEYLWNATIVPTSVLPLDAGRVRAPAIDVFESIDHALAYRPDLLSLRLDVARSGIEIARAKNQLLPKVDVEGSVTWNAVEDSFEEAMDTTTTGDFYDWQVGLAVEIPFGNRAAMARYQQALIGLRQAADRVERAERAAILEVRSAAREVESKAGEINAAKEAKEFARAKWEAERSRYQSGERTAFEVNEFRNDFIRARFNEVRAFTEYFKALADLKKAESSSLERLRQAGYRVAPRSP